MWGSTLVADGKVYVGDEDGDFAVLAASKDKKVISETNLGRRLWHAVVANGTVFMQSNTHLFSFARRPDQGWRNERRTAEVGYPVEEISA